MYTLLNSINNIFLFPSHFEGLGLAAVEAQYYGMNTFVSSSLPAELNVSNYIDFLPLNEDAWINAITSCKSVNIDSVNDCKKIIHGSNIEYS